MARPAASVSDDLTEKSTSSAPRSPLGSVLARMEIVSSEAEVCSRRPERSIACTCCGRPINVTARPARASMAP